ncbi:flavin-containing monooxygenase [Cryobacterium flavum]|uniref:flavin-containing monooxygenase n=1 Tax=Cryobacterium flavum TaxID=1424659 RepID=UPI0018E08DDB|nr:NAD(P)/FAD-dependent oxidoreductase [Cryobacterium flavum]
MNTSSNGILDVAIIGAGLTGMYALHKLREEGHAVRVFDRADGVGGTWWWNRYPGARVDSPGAPFYCYTFSEDLVAEWEWLETQPDQPAILSYLNHVADRFDLRRDIQLATSITDAAYEEDSGLWVLATSKGEEVRARYLISAVGTLSDAYKPAFDGLASFRGEVYHTGHWPQDHDVDFTGKRVGIIGTGSSGVQLIPIIAESAAALTVFQRTPQYVLPARNRPLAEELKTLAKENWPELRERAVATGRPLPKAQELAVEASQEERNAVYEQAWLTGGMSLRDCYGDHMSDPEANELVAEFVRKKIREAITDPDVAEQLLPYYIFGAKRLILGTGYYEAFNRDNVSIVDVKKAPIVCITDSGVETSDGFYELDVLILATGYDAITGGLTSLNPRGRDGVRLRDVWSKGVQSYLGLAVSGFPNMFIMHGPQTPAVKYPMHLGAELQGDWIAGIIRHAKNGGFDTVEAQAAMQPAWGKEVAAIADRSLYSKAESWYMGSNIPGKPRQFMVHLDGPGYHRRIHEVAESGYEGFEFSKADVAAESDAYAAAVLS